MLDAIKSPFQLTRKLPAGLTSYDLLKSLALILMFVDHVGYFFFPDESWFRVIGRLSVPVWFFLIGYANAREVQSVIWIGAIVVALSAIVSGEYLLPMNILVSLALARLWIDRIVAGALQSYESFAGMFFLLFFLSFPSMFLFEYGTMAFMFTVIGFLRRHKEGLNINRLALFGFVAIASIFYTVVSGLLIIDLNYAQLWFLLGGMFCLIVLLFNFEAREFTGASKALGRAIKPFQLMGRHTLFIYVVHLLVFRGVMLFSEDDRFALFEVEVLPPFFAHIIQSFIG